MAHYICDVHHIDKEELEYPSMKYCNVIGQARGPNFSSATELKLYCILRIGVWILLYPQARAVYSIVSSGQHRGFYYVPRICGTWQRFDTCFTHGNRQGVACQEFIIWRQLARMTMRAISFEDSYGSWLTPRSTMTMFRPIYI